MRKSIVFFVCCLGFITSLCAQEQEKKDDFYPSSTGKDHYIRVGVSPLVVLNFKDLATSPKTYTGYFHAVDIGYLTRTYRKETEIRLTFYSAYPNFKHPGKDYFDAYKNGGRMTSYSEGYRSKLWTLNRWTTKSDRFLAGYSLKGLVMLRADPFLGNSGLGVDVIAGIMPKIKYYHYFRRENDSWLTKLFVPKKGFVSASVEGFLNTWTYRNKYYTYTSSIPAFTPDGNLFTGLASQFFTGYQFNTEVMYTKFFGTHNHMLFFSMDWGMFNSGGKIQPLIVNNLTFSAGLMFNLK